jgi:hypothetical protein
VRHVRVLQETQRPNKKQGRFPINQVLSVVPGYEVFDSGMKQRSTLTFNNSTKRVPGSKTSNTGRKVQTLLQNFQFDRKTCKEPKFAVWLKIS